jgi:death-on-curing protein
VNAPEPIWLDPRAVVSIHQRQLAEHGGPTGIRDLALLASSLAAPRQAFGCADLDLHDLAACYGVRLARNLPFADGNKRTAWVCTRLFLCLNGRDIEALQTEQVRVILQVAQGAMDQATFAAWLRAHSRTPG